ncbi:GDSL-type esterase/lipase family protein [Parvibaculum sp.]|uniref:GDSL-type esterase/lipase family protein n=1 Tax=Parvibaculum sp. TaxID=2024848 RepID=UPI002BA957F7|nr:GDSL-type esterase/lipase family protein [Parvibaculum sp.]HUD52073.1 GDSL-type esterase/lipase family protein [Parvibaculum sp.]
MTWIWRRLAVLTLPLLLAACASLPPALVEPPSFAPHRVVAGDPPPLARTPFFVQPERMAEKRAALETPVDLVFIGDSITQNYDRASAKPAENYKPVWDAFYGDRHALNLGYGMDTTSSVLWRLQQGEIDGIAPKLAIVLIGTNDTNIGASAADTVSGIDAVVAAIHARLPRTKILLLGILPSGRSLAKIRADARINAELAAHYEESDVVTFLDIGHVFLKDGAPDPALYVEPEGRELHPNARGQAAMAAAIEPTVARLMGTTPKTPAPAGS